MNAKDYWTIFMETGAPAFYLQYKGCKMEEDHVSDDPWPGAPGHGIQ